MNQVPANKSETRSTRRDVAVAIAAYNGAKYLPALLDSILAQTVPPAEIVCSDDASTDDTVAVLEAYAASSPVPLKIVRHERNVGIIENFLSAFRATSAPLIAYCDQDDVWLERKLELCLEAFADPAVSFVSHASILTDGELRDTGEVYYRMNGDWRIDFPAVSTKHHCWGHQMIFDRPSLEVLLSFYESEDFRRTGYGTCFDYGIPFSAGLVGSLHVLGAPLVKFRRHQSATTGAGLDVGGAKAGLSARLAERVERLRFQEKMTQAAVMLIDECPPAGAKLLSASRDAYENALELLARRARLSATRGFFGRCAQLPGIAVAALFNNPTRIDFRFKELAADVLTVLFAGQSHKARA